VCALALLEPAGAQPGVRCAGLVGLAGPYDLVAHLGFEARRGVDRASMMSPACAPLAEHSPTLLVQRGARLGCSRVLLLHGEKDKTVPPSSSALFALALTRAGQPGVEYIPLPADTHMSFLIDLMLGRRSDLLGHLRRFCGVEGRGGAAPTGAWPSRL